MSWMIGLLIAVLLKTGGPRFPACVRLHGDSMNVDGSVMRLKFRHGRAAEVKIGRRRINNHLLSPLRRYVDESLQEK